MLNMIQCRALTFLHLLFRSLESSLYNKANELQEDISMKRFDLRVAQIHLGAVRAQVGPHVKALIKYQN
jgi:aromatic ring-cleaving dioxygenase